MSINNRVFQVIFLLISLLLIVNLASDIWRLVKVEKRLEVAEDQLAAVKKRNQAIKEEQEYYQSDTFLEGEIRDKLQMAKPGEAIVVLPEKLKISTGAGYLANPMADQLNDKKNLASLSAEPNWRKWLELFL